MKSIGQGRAQTSSNPRSAENKALRRDQTKHLRPAKGGSLASPGKKRRQCHSGHLTYFDVCFGFRPGFWSVRIRLRVASSLVRKAWLPSERPVRSWCWRRDWRSSGAGWRRKRFYFTSFLPASSMALSMASAIWSKVSFVSGGSVTFNSLRSDSRTG